MSDDNLPGVQGAFKGLQTRKEFTERDLAEIEDYKNDGAPEISSIAPDNLKKVMELYLEGRTFREISQTMRVRRVSVMYLAQRFNWWDIRQNFIEEMQNQITHRVIESKLSSQTFLLKLVHNWERKISKQIDAYQRGDTKSEENTINFKEVDKYLKTVDTLHKLTADSSNRLKSPTPAIGLNIGDGVTMEKNGNTVTISPVAKEKSVAEMLKQMADAKRQDDEDRLAGKEEKK